MIFTPAATRSSATACAALPRHGEHAHHHAVGRHHGVELVVVADRQVAESAADPARVDVEDRRDAEAVVGEHAGRRDRLPEVSGAEQGDVVLPGGPQDLPDLLDQRVDVVADPALAELAEPGQVAADLGGIDVGVLGDRLRGDAGLPHLLGLCQHLEIAGEPRGDPEGEAVSGHGAGLFRRDFVTFRRKLRPGMARSQVPIGAKGRDLTVISG